MPLIKGNEILVFAPMYNTKGKKDATYAFQPEAQAFAHKHGVPPGNVFLIDNHQTKTSMRKAVLDAIECAATACGAAPKMAAFFCHGFRDGVQFGFDRRNVFEAAEALASVRDVRVALYACSTAKGENIAEDMEAFGGDGGFADLFRDALCAAGAVNCRVDAHSTAGHTTMNPYVRRFEGMGSSVGGTGGYFIVSPSKKALWAQWRKQLRETDLRYSFPLLTLAEIHAGLTA